jgi:hypothetical protein
MNTEMARQLFVEPFYWGFNTLGLFVFFIHAMEGNKIPSHSNYARILKKHIWTFEKKKRTKRQWEISDGHYTKKEWNRDKFMAKKVLRQCPLVSLVKVIWRNSKAFRNGEGKEIESVWRRAVQWVLLQTTTNLNFGINLGRVAFGEIFMLIWREATLSRNSYVDIRRTIWDGCSKRGIWIST